MRVLKLDAAEGFLHLKLDTLDDLWSLRNVIQDGDLVVADTHRTAEAAGDKVRSEKMEKRGMRLGVRAQQVEWHDFDDHLRVLGPIETGPQDHGRHHTLVLRADGSDVQVTKRQPLSPWEVAQVRKAAAAAATPQLLLLAIDDSEAQFALLKPHGLQVLGALPSAGQGKRHPGAAEAKRAFYDEAARSLALFRPDPAVPALVVGPGWWREEFVAFVRERNAAQAANLRTEGTSQGGRAGLQEALRGGAVDRVVQGHRVQQETTYVDELLDHVARGDGLATYGPDAVRRAVTAGAARVVLASDRMVRSGAARGLLDAAETARAEIHIVSTAHEAGERLDRLGGLAALLRFRLDE